MKPKQSKGPRKPCAINSETNMIGSHFKGNASKACDKKPQRAFPLGSIHNFTFHVSHSSIHIHSWSFYNLLNFMLFFFYLFLTHHRFFSCFCLRVVSQYTIEQQTINTHTNITLFISLSLLLR